MQAPEKITGMSLEWTGHHHSTEGDYEELSTHTLTYVTDTTCFATANGALVGEADYEYRRLDDQIGICIYRPNIWQGRTDVVLHAIFDFAEMTDRAVITSGGAPLAVADGCIKCVPVQTKPTA